MRGHAIVVTAVGLPAAAGLRGHRRRRVGVVCRHLLADVVVVQRVAVRARYLRMEWQNVAGVRQKC